MASHPSPPQTKSPRHWDAFICHASEDKDSVARPLAEALRSHGLKVWYDEFSLQIGDSLRRKIEHGTANSRFGIVMISPSFFAKEWPQRELDILVGREVRSRRKRILPVWHDVDKRTVARHSPILADRFAARTSDGIDEVAEKILRKIQNRRVLAPGSPSSSRDDAIDVSFKEIFSSRLDELTKLLEHLDWKSTSQVEDLIDSVVMIVKDRIDKWDVPSVRYATRELFLRLYKFQEKKVLNDVYQIFGDLFSRAYSQRTRLLGEMIEVFDTIMFESWIPDDDVQKGESAARIILNLGRSFLSKDMQVVRGCLMAIDNLAGDFFAPEILSKEILLTCAAFEAPNPSDALKNFVKEATDWIKTNDQYAWDDENHTYLRDAIDYASWEQSNFDLNTDGMKREVLYPVLLENIDKRIEDFANLLSSEVISENGFDYERGQMVRLVLDYESLRPNIAQELKERLLQQKDPPVDKTFNSIVSGSQFLKEVYGQATMITTIDELIQFIQSNADLDNHKVGFTTFSISWIRFVKSLNDDQKTATKGLLRKYGIEEDSQLGDNELQFEMDKLVYRKNEGNDMRKLIEFLRETNKIVEINGFGTGIDFNLRRLTPP